MHKNHLSIDHVLSSDHLPGTYYPVALNTSLYIPEKPTHFEAIVQQIGTRSTFVRSLNYSYYDLKMRKTY